MNDNIMHKVAEVAPRHYAFLVKTAEEIKASPFREEVLGELNFLIKKADWNSVRKGLGSAGRVAGKGALALGGAVGAAAAGGIAIALAGDMYDAAKRGITKGRNYRSMMQANPFLKGMPAKEVQKAFSVLHHFNPEFSGDPTISGAWVGRQVTQNDSNETNLSYADAPVVKNLIDSRKAISDTKKLTPFKMDREKAPPPSGIARADYNKDMSTIHGSLGQLHDRFTAMDKMMNDSIWPIKP